MGLFDSILERLGLKRDKPAEESSASAGSPGKGASRGPAVDISRYVTKRGPSEMDMVDVESMLNDMAKEAGQELNWKESIVDLLKLLGIDSSLEARKQLATELNASSETMEDSARMNIWLHKEVMQKVAENGGKVPKSLLD